MDMLGFPRTYTVVRQGRQARVSVATFEDLVNLRTELELVRRFGAGATPALIEALDRRIAEVEAPGHPGPTATDEQLAELLDMRAILCDALSPVNGRAVAEIDADCPQAKAGATMDSINQDTQEFRQNVTHQLQASPDEDLQALLASFDNASPESAPEASRPTEGHPGGDTHAEAARADLDADLEALLAQAAEGELEGSGLAALAASIEAADDTLQGELSLADLPKLSSPEELSEPTPPTLEPGWGPLGNAGGGAAAPSLSFGIEEVTEQVTERLNNAEQQLDAIASAFEVAAAELGQVKAEAPAQLTAVQPATIVEQAGEEMRADQGFAMPKPTPEAPATTAIPAPEFADAHSPESLPSRTADQLRTQLRNARTNILSELDDLLVLLDRADQMQAQAAQSVRKAREFERTAARTQQAAAQLAAAEAEAAQARAGLEEAQQRVDAARNLWTQAQQEASAVAGSL